MYKRDATIILKNPEHCATVEKLNIVNKTEEDIVTSMVVVERMLNEIIDACEEEEERMNLNFYWVIYRANSCLNALRYLENILDLEDEISKMKASEGTNGIE